MQIFAIKTSKKPPGVTSIGRLHIYPGGIHILQQKYYIISRDSLQVNFRDFLVSSQAVIFITKNKEGHHMKLPNGYGSIIKLKGARRAPWAVRISYLEEQPDGTVKRKRKYLAYFAEQKSAISYLAEYNNGAAVREHQRFVDSPTFSELYEKWKKYRHGLKSNPTASTWRNATWSAGRRRRLAGTASSRSMRRSSPWSNSAWMTTGNTSSPTSTETTTPGPSTRTPIGTRSCTA